MIVIDKWAGLVTNAGQYALPPGAAVTQVNLQILSPGQIVTRPGMRAVTWTSHTAQANPIIRAFRYQHGTVEQVLYQDSSGGISIAKGLQ